MEAVPIVTKVVVILVIPKEVAPAAEATVVGEAVVVVEGTDANRAILKILAGVQAEVLRQLTRVGMTTEAKVGIRVVEAVEVDLVLEAAAVVVEAVGTNAVSTVI